MSELRRFSLSELADGVTPWVEPAEPFTELVASWAAGTPAGASIEVGAQVRLEDDVSDWYSLGRWASHDTSFRRTSVPGQEDALGAVEVDVLSARGAPFTGYRLRVVPTGEPVLRALAGSASAAAGVLDTPSEPLGRAVDLDVPAFAQMTHRGHFPEYGGGGASWCSPASLAMVLAFWGAGPTADELAWVGEGHEDPRGRPCRPRHLRRGLRRLRQLVVRRRVRRRVRARRRRDAAPLAARGRGAARGRNPARGLDRGRIPASSPASCCRRGRPVTSSCCVASRPLATLSSTTLRHRRTGRCHASIRGRPSSGRGCSDPPARRRSSARAPSRFRPARAAGELRARRSGPAAREFLEHLVDLQHRRARGSRRTSPGR